MRALMNRAHELARGMDGDYAARMALALRQAWAEARSSVEDRLYELGGRLWEKNGMRRIYINNLAELYGIEYDCYGSGNISWAQVDGERISNNWARQILDELRGGRVWYDLNSGQFYTRDLSDRAHSRIIAALTARTGVAA